MEKNFLDIVGKRIGIFPGTFDPPHLGHWESAYVITTKLSLDTICIIPINPFDKSYVINYKHRWEMVQLGFSDFPEYYHFPLKLYNKFKTYPYVHNYLITIRDYFGADNKYFLIMSLEVFERYFPREFEEKQTERYAQIALYIRSGERINNPGITKDRPKISYDSKYGNLSSTKVRDHIRQKMSFKHFLKNRVYQYILDYDLYKANNLYQESF